MQQGSLVRVFVAGPGDVKEEREEACRVIENWNAANSLKRSVLIEAVRNETHSQAVQGAHPQDLINGQLLGLCDLLVAIFWSRIGTPTDKDRSGTIQEIREFSEAKGADRVLLFFSKQSYPNSIDTDQLNAVREFKQDMQDKGLYIEYKSTAEFSDRFRQQLDMAMDNILESNEATVMAPTGRQEVSLSPESCTLLVAAAISDRGLLLLSRTRAGHEVSVNGVCYSQGRNPRSEARWEAGIKQLESEHIVDAGQNREVFRLTEAGYQEADRLWCVLLLRVIEKLQSSECDYIDTQDLSQEMFLGQSITASFVQEKSGELCEAETIEIVPSDGKIAAVRLTNKGRKSLREHSRLKFSESDVDSDRES